MKKWSEGKAFGAATCASATVLAVTLGIASLMQHAPFSVVLTGIPNAPAALKPIELTPEAAQGRHLFLMNCAHCHADDATGDEGPDLHNLHKSDARIHQVITSGIKGEMPSFGKKLGDPEIRQLTAYLRTLNT
jgi:mono/diheme cytochrome c family protein